MTLFVSGTFHKEYSVGQDVRHAHEVALERKRNAEDLARKRARSADGEQRRSQSREPPRPTSKKIKAQVSMRELLEAGMIRPGHGVISAAIKHRTYRGDLLPTGAIQFEGRVYETPTVFMAVLRQRFAPEQAGQQTTPDDGWRTVHAHGVSLEDSRHKYLLMKAAGQQPVPWPSQMPQPWEPPQPPQHNQQQAEGAAPAPADPQLPPLPSAFDIHLPKVAEAAAEEAEGEAEPDTANWVQCSRCQAWRVVPDEFWPDIDAAGDEDWFCNEATWDLTAYEPYTEACK